MYQNCIRRLSNSLIKQSTRRYCFSRNGLQCSSTPCNVQLNPPLDLAALRKSLEISVPPLASRITPPATVPKPLVDIAQTERALIDPEPDNKAEVLDPTVVIERQAARMIVIRKRKMRRHKLKKLRKKMKHVYLKVRQKREYKKEKNFQAELMAQIKQAEKFDATAYVNDKIAKANETLLPKLWKGKRLPEFVIKDLIAERKSKFELSNYLKERKKLVTDPDLKK